MSKIADYLNSFREVTTAFEDLYEFGGGRSNERDRARESLEIYRRTGNGPSDPAGFVNQARGPLEELFGPVLGSSGRALIPGAQGSIVREIVIGLIVAGAVYLAVRLWKKFRA